MNIITTVNTAITSIGAPATVIGATGIGTTVSMNIAGRHGTAIRKLENIVKMARPTGPRGGSFVSSLARQSL
jgi:hypothetical protein